MTDDFDPTPYVRPPVIDVASGVALGVALLAALPKGSPDNVRKAARRVRASTLALQDAWAQSEATPSPPDRRKVDLRVDRAWGCFLDRLESYAGLPADRYPKASRAAELVAAIAPAGREWLKLPYGAEWAESDRRLKKIDAEGLAGEADLLAGPEFLAEVREAHAAYGEALGVTAAAPDSVAVNLAAPLRALAKAVARYGLAVAGWVDDDEASVQAARKALRPIDELREAQLRRGGAGGPATPAEPPAAPAGPRTPVPDVQ